MKWFIVGAQMKMSLNQTLIEQICHKFFKDIEHHTFNVYLTKGNNIAIILSHQAGGSSPLLGAYYTSNDPSDGEWIPAKWQADGMYPSINDKLTHCPLDLIIDTDTDTIPNMTA